MIYYKVKAEFDNLVIKRKLKHYKNLYNDFLIANELYTQRERDNLLVNDNVFDKIELPKEKTYIFFGARFILD